jgi:predicted MPP superfamily phosphohydrolase
VIWVVVVLAPGALAAGAWGWFEAGWLRRRVLEVELEGVPAELDGLRIAHLSDFHLGVPSRGAAAVDKAVAWVVERKPDLVCLTGDLVSRRTGLAALRRILGELSGCFVVLGNHDFASSRDPFSEPIAIEDVSGVDGVSLLVDEAQTLAVRDRRVQLVGVDPRTYAMRRAQPEELSDADADLRILLCHFPGIAHNLPPNAFDLVLAGHFHAGQIVLPLPTAKVRVIPPHWSRLRFAHLRARDVEGLHRYRSTVLHISPGLGTTFVPFRFFARPEVTELVIRSAQ